MDLVKKYRPLRLKDVRGHSNMIRWMTREIRSQAPASVLLSGPPGVGKTLSGQLFAKAISCDSPWEGDACGKCQICGTFESRGLASDVRSYQCGEHSTVDKILELLEIARTSPFVARRRVFLIDEMHNLSPRAMDALLAITEKSPDWTTFIFMTSKIQRIPHAIQARLKCFELQPFDYAGRFGFLAEICDREGMEYEERALALIAHVVPGAPRDLLRALDKFQSINVELSERNVREEFGLNVLTFLEGTVQGVLQGDLARVFAAVNGSQQAAEQKLELLQMLFGRVYFVNVLRMRVDEPVIDLFDSNLAEALVKRVSESAARLRVAEGKAWSDLIELLNPHGRVTDTRLKTIVIQLAELIATAPTVVKREDLRSTSGVRAHVVRPSKQAKEKNLSWETARAVWRAASFLSQHYGKTLNIRASIRTPGLDIGNAALATSNLTRRLHMRLQQWSGNTNAEFHWLWIREKGSGGLVTRIAFAVPEALLERASLWVHSRFNASKPNCNQVTWRALNTHENQVRFHWNSVRHLIRSLHPRLVSQDRSKQLVPLVDLLQIPPRFRHNAVIEKGHERGASQSLGPGYVRSALPILSAVDDGAWNFATSGWEMQEHSDRQKAEDEFQQAERLLRTRFSAGTIGQARLSEELELLRLSVHGDAKHRLRTWQGWWHDQ